MSEILIHDYFIPIKGVKKKVVCHFGDSHVSAYDGLSTVEEREKAKKQCEAWDKVGRDFALCYHEPYGEEQAKSGLCHLQNTVSLCNELNPDFTLITGDTLDFVSGGNLRVCESEIKKLCSDYMLLCGNHEQTELLPDAGICAKMKQPVQIYDFGDLIIAGFDDSKRVITQEQINALKEVIKKGKPVIVALHIPIMNDENREVMLKCGEYFRLNYDSCPKENEEFIQILKRSDNVFAIFAGHLHFLNVSSLTPKITQYVTSQGVAGNMNRYFIGE